MSWPEPRRGRRPGLAVFTLFTVFTAMRERAGISRQGLYFYFPTKEALFREAVRQEMAVVEVSQWLEDRRLPTVDRLIGALDAWFGRFVGTQVLRDIGNLLDDNKVQLNDLVTGYVAGFESRLIKVIPRVLTRTDLKRIGVSSDQVAATLILLGRAIKFEVESRPEFLDKITVAVRLICAGRA